MRQEPLPPPVKVRVEADLEGERLDKALAALAPAFSRRRIRDLIAQGSVFVDGARVQVAGRGVRAGQELSIRDVPAPAVAGGDEAASWIVHRGEDYVVVNKPAGVPVVPTRTEALSCLTQVLRPALGPEIHPVHRIDRPASGLVMLALNSGAMARLSKRLMAGTVVKGYAVLADGPWEGVHHLDAPLADPRGRTQEARTSVQAWPAGHGSACLVRIHTGRLHQIRRHLAQAGHPVAGDDVYGSAPRAFPPGQDLRLHAACLDFGDGPLFAPPPWDWAAPILDAASCRERLDCLEWPLA